MEFTFPQLLALLRRWWWVLIIGILVGGGVGYGVSSQAEPVYSASALMQVNLPPSDESADPDRMEASESIARTYRQLIWTRQVLEPVVVELNLPYGVDHLRDHVTAWTISGTQFIQINVQDGDPDRAAQIANQIVASLAVHTQGEAEQLASRTQEDLRERLATTLEEIDDVTAEIAALEAQADGSPGSAAQVEVDQLYATLEELQQTELSLRALQWSTDINTTTSVARIALASAAEPATDPDEPQPRVAAMFGAGFGLLIAMLVILLLGYTDKTVKSPSDLAALAGAPLLGEVGKKASTRTDLYPLFVLRHPHDSDSDAVRAIRANLSLRFINKGNSRLVLSSTGPDPSRSVVVSNLALAAAQSGLRTLLIDANLDDPVQHRYFDISNHRGLSSWLWLPGATSEPWQDLATQTIVQNLRVIPSGPIVDMPAEALLSSDRLRVLLSRVDEETDLVLIDAAPVLTDSAALLVAAESQGVVLFCRTETTTHDEVVMSAEKLKPASAPLVGVVANGLSLEFYEDPMHASAARPHMSAVVPYMPAAAAPPLDAGDRRRIANSAD